MKTYRQIITVLDFIDDFCGRKGYDLYNPEKTYSISELNRDNVWSEKMQKQLIKSMLMGYPVPEFNLADNELLDGGNRSTAIWKFYNNYFSVKLDDIETPLYYSDLDKDYRVLCKKLDGTGLSFCITVGATQQQKITIFENLNKGKPLAYGNKLINRRMYPTVAIAARLIRWESEYEFTPELNETLDNLAVITKKIWCDKFKSGPTKKPIGDMFNIVSGILFGSRYNVSSFEKNYVNIIFTNMSYITDKINDIQYIFGFILNCIERNDSIDRKRIKDVFTKFSSTIIYDFHEYTTDMFELKWKRFLASVYDPTVEDSIINTLVDIGKKRGTHEMKNKEISGRIVRYLKDPVLCEYVESNDDSDSTDSDSTDSDE